MFNLILTLYLSHLFLLLFRGSVQFLANTKLSSKNESVPEEKKRILVYHIDCKYFFYFTVSAPHTTSRTSLFWQYLGGSDQLCSAGSDLMWAGDELLIRAVVTHHLVSRVSAKKYKFTLKSGLGLLLLLTTNYLLWLNVQLVLLTTVVWHPSPQL